MTYSTQGPIAVARVRCGCHLVSSTCSWSRIDYTCVFIFVMHQQIYDETLTKTRLKAGPPMM